MKLNKLSHTGPSLAVKFYKQWCFCSIGPFIEIFDFRTGASVGKCQIFRRNKVHGIKIHATRDLIAVYGGKSVAVIPLSELFLKESLFDYEKMCSEWVVTAEFNYSGREVYLLTSYNRVIIMDLDGKIVDEKSVFGERSILYSGSIKVYENELIVIAGTVMNGIIVWNGMEEKKIHNLVGHEGAIFNVVSSDCGKYIASCSDDRSIKIWDSASGELLTTAWGHTARIWSLKFFNANSNLISVSEDCTCRIWSFANNELRMTDIFEVHLTKNVWSIDVEENEMIAVTGGNDGRIKLIELNSQSSDSISKYTLSEIAEECNAFEHLKNEIIKGFHWFEFGLVITTSEGRIIEYIEDSRTWKLLDHDSRFFSFSIVNGTNDSLIIMNNKCCIKVLQFDSTGVVRKMRDIFLNELSKTVNCLLYSSANGAYLLVESPNPNDPLVCLEFDPSEMELRKKYYFSKPKNMVSSSVSCHKNLLLVGARFGLTYIFDFGSVTKDAIEIRTTANDAVTSIEFIEEGITESLFSMTTRDGKFFFFEIYPREFDARIVHSSSVSRGFLEGSYFDENGSFFVYGFKSNLFYVYNETEQYEVWTQPCGGAHRQWKLFQRKNNTKLFCFVQNSCLNWKKFSQPDFPEIFKNGLHGREIRDLSIRKRSLYDEDTYLFLSGAEDTTLKLSSINQKRGTIKNIWTFKSHVSGLQRCKFINSQFAVSCSAREELFLWELIDKFSRPYMTLKKKLPPSTDDPDLRIMDFDIMFVPGSTTNFIMATVYSDSKVKVWYYEYEKNLFQLLVDGRYETCCILNVLIRKFDHRIYLFISPTDGHVVHWDITMLFPPEISGNESKNNESGSFPCALCPYIQKLPVHLAGIKSFDIQVKENCLIIYTGGDDNALGLIKYYKSKEILKGEVIAFEASAASSTVTSVQLESGSSRLWTTSVDQIIRIWDVAKDELDLVDSAYTTVADTGASDCLTTEKGTFSLVGGLGLSCWCLNEL